MNTKMEGYDYPFQASMGFLSLAVTQAWGRRRLGDATRRQAPPHHAGARSAVRFLALLHRIRWPAALLGMAWWSAWLPAWAQSNASVIPTEAAPVVEAIKQQAPQAVNSVTTPIATTAVQAAGQRLLDSYELCKIGRMGQSELSFLTVFILIGCFVFFLQIDRRLIKSGWDLRRALSEASEISFLPEGPRSEPLLNPKGEAVSVRVMVPSVSRLIALSGLIMLILFYFGFGLIGLYHFGRTCEMPGDMQGVTTFLYAGLTFFAPYLVSKFASIFGKPGRRLPLPGTQPEPLEPAAAPVPPTPPPVVQREAIIPPRPSTNGPIAVAVAPPSPPKEPGAAATVSAAAPATAPASSPQVNTKPQGVAVAAPPRLSAPATRHPDGVELIKEFEGFRDRAYPDPASGGDPWTIGYGFTRIDNKPVRPGQTLSQPAADQLLEEMLAAMASRYTTKIPFWDEMHDKQQSCLLSFGWNLGEDFYGDETGFHTITQCLRSKDWLKVPEALLLYCMPGTAVHAGLLRRRTAEADLWKQGMAAAGTSPAKVGPAAPDLNANLPSRPIAAGASTNGSQVQQAKPAMATPKVIAHPNPIPVEYFDQMLMADGQGWRDCFSASCGMLARYWGKVNDQNKYNHIRQQYGDSTDSNAQLKALQSLGLKARFRTDGKPDMLKAEIDAGRPVAVGWLHHGSVSAPSGGGHWTVVIGYDDSGFWMNDPYGSCDLVNGG